MKTSITYLLLTLGLFLGQNILYAQSVQFGAQISVNKETHDYGTLKLHANGDCEFVITNTGNEPLVFVTVKGSCSCTVPSWPTEPIEPGKTGVIKVKYDTSRPGPISKSVTITSNAVDEPLKVLRIVGNVLPAQDNSIPAAEEPVLEN